MVGQVFAIALLITFIYFCFYYIFLKDYSKLDKKEIDVEEEILDEVIDNIFK